MFKHFYASHSIYSHPGPYHEALTLGGQAPKSIARWINSFMQHPRGADSQKRGFVVKQVVDLELRCVTEILAAATERKLFDGDPKQIKIGGLCRDFAILAASAFRNMGIPARLRVGFADYIVPDFWEDHWLCEWHDGQCWYRFDVEFAAVDGFLFNTLDVPRERFLMACEAWLRIQNEPGIASRFGVSSLDLAGEWFVAGSLLREVAALRKLELKPWDYWGLSKGLSPVSTALSREARKTLDQLARRLGSADVEGEGEPGALAGWPLPREVLSFPQGEPVVVVLPNL